MIFYLFNSMKFLIFIFAFCYMSSESPNDGDFLGSLLLVW